MQRASSLHGVRLMALSDDAKQALEVVEILPGLLSFIGDQMDDQRLHDAAKVIRALPLWLLAEYVAIGRNDRAFIRYGEMTVGRGVKVTLDDET